MMENTNKTFAGLTIDDACYIVSRSRGAVHAPENSSSRSTVMGPVMASQKCSAEKIASISAMKGLKKKLYGGKPYHNI